MELTEKLLRRLTLFCIVMAIVCGIILAGASIAGASCHYYCKPGQALTRMKSYISSQCHKWDSALAQTACFRTSNGANPPGNTRIYWEGKYAFKGYGTYVYGYYGVPEKCELVRIWEGLSKVDGHLWRIATETVGVHC